MFCRPRPGTPALACRGPLLTHPSARGPCLACRSAVGRPADGAADVPAPDGRPAGGDQRVLHRHAAAQPWCHWGACAPGGSPALLHALCAPCHSLFQGARRTVENAGTPFLAADPTACASPAHAVQKNNQCVACGELGHYLRYRVVPACFRRAMPVRLKSHRRCAASALALIGGGCAGRVRIGLLAEPRTPAPRSHDIVLLCVSCHELAHAVRAAFPPACLSVGRPPGRLAPGAMPHTCPCLALQPCVPCHSRRRHDTH